MLTFVPRLAAAVLSFFIGFASYQAYLFCVSYLDEIASAEVSLGPTQDAGAHDSKPRCCGYSTFRATRSTFEAIRASVSKKEPRLEYIPVFCTCGGLFHGDRQTVEGSWQRKGHDELPSEVSVEIHEAESCEVLAGWLGRLNRGEEPGWGKWNGQRYDLGDEAYLTQPNEKNPNYHLYVRVNNLLVVVEGSSLPEVERFAKYALAELPAS